METERMTDLETLTAWARWQQKLAWSDLSNALDRAVDRVWSMDAADRARSIVQAARMVGATSHREVQYKLVAGGVYEAVLRAGGIEPDMPDEAEWQRLDALMAKYETTREICRPQFAATVAKIQCDSETAWIAEEFDPEDGAT